MDLLFRLNQDVEGFGDVNETKMFFREVLPERDKNYFYSTKKYNERLKCGDTIYFVYNSYLVAKAIFLGEIETNTGRDEKYIHGHKVVNVQILDGDVKLDIEITGSRTRYVEDDDVRLEIERVLGRRDEINLSNDIEQILNDPTIEVTEKLALVKSRIGQGQFRKLLLEYWRGCAVSGYENEKMLVASHIKPWAHSSDVERLDKFNGLLLTPALDRAFDRGLITFSKSGSVVISPDFKEPQIVGITEDVSFQITPQHEEYMQYHREHVYQTKQ